MSRLWQAADPVVADGEVRVVCQLPRMPVGIGDVPAVAAPLRGFGMVEDPGARGHGLGRDGIDLLA